ncbi:MAG TPA: hypothetical protein ACFYD4_16725 [Candidatus Wunengus sp. YC61]
MEAKTWFKGISEIKAAKDRGLITKDQATDLILALEVANKNPLPIES